MSGRRRQEPVVRVDEGRLVESPLADASGIERRAFGEFEGPRGELASFAFGWVDTMDDSAEGRLCVGIGHGNPGGGTFNIAVRRYDDGIAYGLVDEPFETVPQGGPHLSATEARAHDDLPFIWAVVDTVMARDRRAWWMRHCLLGTTAVITGEVAARREPALLVTHDDDGIWQLIGTSDADPATGQVEHLHHLVEDDPTLLDVLDLMPNERADRDGVGGPWVRAMSGEPDQ